MTPIWCQVLGMAWQKAWTAPDVLGLKRALLTKMTPDVPSDTKPSPGRVAPMPQAAAALSPAPPATTLPLIRQRRANSGFSVPETAGALN